VRALFYLHPQVRYVTQPVVRAKLGQLIAAGDAMDYAVRLRGHGNELTPDLAAEFAVQVVGLSSSTMSAEDRALPQGMSASLSAVRTSSQVSADVHVVTIRPISALRRSLAE
jgi:hypothetical protein